MDTIIGSRSTPTEEVHRTVRRNGSITVDSIIRCCITDEIPLVSRKAPSPGFTEVGSRSLQVTFCEGDLVAIFVNRELTAQSSGRSSATRVEGCKSCLCIEQGLIVAYQCLLISSEGIVRSARAFNRIARSEFELYRRRDVVNLSNYLVCLGLVESRQSCLSVGQFLYVCCIEDSLGVFAQCIVSITCCLDSVHASIIERYRNRDCINQVFHCLRLIQRIDSGGNETDTKGLSLITIISSCRVLTRHVPYIMCIGIIVLRAGIVEDFFALTTCCDIRTA